MPRVATSHGEQVSVGHVSYVSNNRTCSGAGHVSYVSNDRTCSSAGHVSHVAPPELAFGSTRQAESDNMRVVSRGVERRERRDRAEVLTGRGRRHLSANDKEVPNVNVI